MEFYKKLIDEINKVRKDPNAFAEKLLRYKQYFEGNFLVLPGSDSKVETQEDFKAYEEAANILKNAGTLPVLSPSKGLGKIAADFFEKIKETDPDNIGDIDLNSLISKYGSFSGVFENIIEFGNNSPELIVTNCIVCDGNPERENRNILLSKDLLKVGMAFGAHVTYGYCTIIISCTEFKNVDNSNDLEFFSEVPKEEEPKEEELKVLRRKRIKKEPEKPVEEEVKPKTEEVEIPKIEVVSLLKPEEEEVKPKTEEIPKIEKIVLDKEKPDEILIVGAKTIEKPEEEEVKPKTEEVETPKIEVVNLEKPVEEVPKMEVVSLSKPEEEEVEPKSEEIPKIEVIVKDKEKSLVLIVKKPIKKEPEKPFEEKINEDIFNDISYNCTECSSLIEIISLHQDNNFIKFKCLNKNNSHEKTLSIKEYLQKMKNHYNKQLNDDICKVHTNKTEKYVCYCFNCKTHLCTECLKSRTHLKDNKNSITEIQPIPEELNIMKEIIKYYKTKVEKLKNENMIFNQNLENSLNDKKSQLKMKFEEQTQMNKINKSRDLKINDE